MFRENQTQLILDKLNDLEKEMKKQCLEIKKQGLETKMMKEKFEAKETEAQEPLKVFFQKTHLHGFIEFYESNTKRGKIFWIVITLFSLIFSSYQIAMETVNFINTPISTMVNYVTKDQMLYPKFQICYINWLQWFNFTKALNENFTKGEIFYALSFLDPVYTESHIQLELIDSHLYLKLSLLNMSSIKDFYSRYELQDLMWSSPITLPTENQYHKSNGHPYAESLCKIIDPNYTPQFIKNLTIHLRAPDSKSFVKGKKMFRNDSKENDSNFA